MILHYVILCALIILKLMCLQNYIGTYVYYTRPYMLIIDRSLHAQTVPKALRFGITICDLCIYPCA
jgi:hypothetical protein